MRSEVLSPVIYQSSFEKGEIGNKDVQILKVKKKNTTVLHRTQTHTSTLMVSQLALSSEAQIAYLCQGELLKAKQKRSYWV